MPHTARRPAHRPNARVFASAWLSANLIFAAWWALSDLDDGLWIPALAANLAVYAAGLWAQRPPWWWWAAPGAALVMLAAIASGGHGGPGLLINGTYGLDRVFWVAFVVAASHRVSRSRLDTADAIVLGAAAVAFAHLVPSELWHDDSRVHHEAWFHFLVGGTAAGATARVLLSGWLGLQPLRWLASVFALSAWSNFAAAISPDHGSRGHTAAYLALVGLMAALVWHPERWTLDHPLRARVESTGRARNVLIVSAAVPVIDAVDSILFETTVSAIMSLGCMTAAMCGLIARAYITARWASRAHRRNEVAASEERELVARWLHDSAVQHLAAANWALDTGQSDRARELVANATGELRSVIATLTARIPANAEEMDAALRVEADLWPLVWTFDIDDAVFANRSLTLVAYRVAREGIHNAGRHSGGTAGTVRVKVHGGLLVIEVLDDGAGPDSTAWSRAREAGHMGLGALHDDIDELGGVLELNARRSGGAHLRAVVPTRRGSKTRLARSGGGDQLVG